MVSRIKKIQTQERRNVYIFGAGHNGRKLLTYFKLNGIKINAFIDNSIVKQGTYIEGIRVISLNEASDSGLCIISVWEHRKAIRKQAETVFGEDHILDIDEVYMKYHDTYEPLCIPGCSEPLLSVILTVFNGWKLTYNCIQSFLQTKTNIPYEFIVGSNMSTDETIGIEKVVSGVRVIHRKENIGYLKNVNATVSEAKCKYVLVLQNDTYFTDDYWLDDLIKYMEEHNECAAASAEMRGYDGEYVSGAGFVDEKGNLIGYPQSYSNNPYSVSYIQPAAVIFRKDVWDELGGYDEAYQPAWYEDLDLYLRILDKGYDLIIDPSKTFIHYGAKTCGSPSDVIFKEHKQIIDERFGGRYLELQQLTDRRNMVRGITHV